MKEKQDVRPRTFGLSLLIVTFLVLCLMTFAAISVAEARHDLKGSEKKYDKARTYNEAANTAELLIEDYTQKAIADRERALSLIRFSVPMDDVDELIVEAVLTEDSAGRPRYRVTRWQVESGKEWVLDNRIEVLPDAELGW